MDVFARDILRYLVVHFNAMNRSELYKVYIMLLTEVKLARGSLSELVRIY